ncbi:MAG: cupredoxin domain-containing protein [Terracidiphilus sp.]
MRRRLLFLMIAAGTMMAVQPSPKVYAQAAPQRIEITAKRFGFTPGEVTLKKGQPVVLVLKSMDVGHGLRVRELGVDMKVKAGGTAEITITPDKTGDFVGHCSVFCGSGHGSMTFTLHVVA